MILEIKDLCVTYNKSTSPNDCLLYTSFAEGYDLMRYVGTVSRGIRLPVVTRGADIVKIISDSIINAAESERDRFVMRDRDIVGVTESLVARSQGNYVTLDDISNDVAAKFPEGDVAVICPILSRNRFHQLLRGMVKGIRGHVHVVLTLSLIHI